MLLGITLCAAITGTITSRFVAAEEGSAGDAADRLRQVAATRGEGVLTNEEYDAKKAELLPRL